MDAGVLSPSGKGEPKGRGETKDHSFQNLPTLILFSRQPKVSGQGPTPEEGSRAQGVGVREAQLAAGGGGGGAVAESGNISPQGS